MNQGDMIFGQLSSTDLTSISVDIVFQYGSPDQELVGDCRLTDDNQHFVGAFSTKHKGAYTTAPPIINYAPAPPLAGNFFQAGLQYIDGPAPDQCAYNPGFLY